MYLKLHERAAISLAGIVLMSISTTVRADAALLSENDRAQLSTWLGKGPVNLTTIFTKKAGNTSVDFHAAADGKGETLVVMEATTRSGKSFLLGGYNPQAWGSSGGYSLTPEDNVRTAFLFNLTTQKMHRQMLNARNLEELGAYQTLNEAGSGPTFGWGHDLQMSGDLTRGYSLLYSYADSSLANLNLSIADGAAFQGMNDLTYGRFEVYSVSAAVPEPAQYGMFALGLGMLMIVASCRHKVRQ